MYYFYSPYELLVIPGILLGLYAQIKLSATYSKYSQVATQNGMTGAEAAREILDRAGLGGMPIQEVPGHLTDHFDPGKGALFLSSENFHGRSVAAVGVAAHEAGHALQQQASYALFNFRMWMVPATQIASTAYAPILLLGWILGATVFFKMLGIIIGIFTVLTLFQLVTLPVEFDASRRAKEQLTRLGLVQGEESVAVAKVLNAAAMTYVAALVTSALTLLKFIMLANSNRRS
jgi:Zn-dependent membrane protease YugP